MQRQRLQYWPTWLHNDFNCSASLIVFGMTCFYNWFYNVFAKSFGQGVLPLLFASNVFWVGKIHTTQQSVFDLECNLRDAILDYYNCNDANGREIQTIRRCRFFCVFNLVIDVLSRFILWILRDDRDEPFKQRRQVKHSRFNFAGRSRNPVSRKRVALLSHRQLASTCSVCAREELQTWHTTETDL